MSNQCVKAGEFSEAGIMSLLESQSANASTSFLGAAFAFMIASFMWAAPFLVLGAHNKTVKQHRSDALARN
jgi:hypothetical protein